MEYCSLKPPSNLVIVHLIVDLTFLEICTLGRGDGSFVSAPGPRHVGSADAGSPAGDVRTKEPSETAEKSASERGNASSEAHDGGKVSNFRRETGKYKK